MSGVNRSRIRRLEERFGSSARGLVVVQAEDASPESEEAAIAEAKAGGLGLEGDGFIVLRRFSYGWQEGFKPYRIGDVGAMLRHVAEHGRKIYPAPPSRRAFIVRRKGRQSEQGHNPLEPIEAR